MCVDACSSARSRAISVCGICLRSRCRRTSWDTAAASCRSCSRTTMCSVRPLTALCASGMRRPCSRARVCFLRARTPVISIRSPGTPRRRSCTWGARTRRSNGSRSRGHVCTRLLLSLYGPQPRRTTSFSTRARARCGIGPRSGRCPRAPRRPRTCCGARMSAGRTDEPVPTAPWRCCVSILRTSCIRPTTATCIA